MDKIKEIIFKLCSTSGVSGHEQPALETAKTLLEPYAEISFTNNGSLIAIIENNNSENSIMLDAHIDRIGFVVTDINDEGFVKLDKCGGIDSRVLTNARIMANNDPSFIGTICCLPPHLTDGSEDKAIPISKLWADFGATKKEVTKHINIGDTLTFLSEPKSLIGNRITAPALDNRCGVAVLIRVAQLIKNKSLKSKVIILLSSQEETAAFSVDPDEAIAVDVSFASQPDVSGLYSDIELDEGPMICVSSILDKKMSTDLIECAKRNNIPYQIEPIAGRTGTNADSISISKSGIRTAVVSIPQRYMHTPVEVISLSDVENTAELLASYILEMGEKND